MFGRKTPGDVRSPPPSPASAPDAGQMALDALASVLRSMAEFALEQRGVDLATFREEAEAWARHVTLASPPPGRAQRGEPDPGARRDWEGVRQFAREYCRGSSQHATSVAADLRDVVWVFIRNFGEALAQDGETDERIGEQVARLERLVAASEVSELKREVLETVGQLTQALTERRERQRARVASLSDAVRALGHELESARREGETDPLTLVFNRKAFDAQVERLVELSRAFPQRASLLLVDVDHFKAVNDGSGHLVGDEVLRQVANAVVKVFLRKSDFVARYGGDELAVIVRDTPLADAVPLAERLVGRVRALRVPAGEGQVGVTVSVGVAALAPGDEARAWFARADAGLYAAKSAGRDRVGVAPRTASPDPARPPRGVGP